LLIQAELAAIPSAPPGADSKVLDDARTLVGQLLHYIDDLGTFVDAAEKGDAAALRSAVSTIIQGTLLAVDGQISIYRNRQLLFPADDPAHQLVGVTIDLYRAMDIAMRASFEANLDHRSDRAIADEAGALRTLADEIGATTQTGRQNLARTERDIFADLRAHPGTDAVRLTAQVKAVITAEDQIFLVGDDLEKWVRSEAHGNDAVHAAVGQSDALRRLYKLEQQLVSLYASVVSDLAKGG
jgi:hypothetical protein